MDVRVNIYEHVFTFNKVLMHFKILVVFAFILYIYIYIYIFKLMQS